MIFGSLQKAYNPSTGKFYTEVVGDLVMKQAGGAKAASGILFGVGTTANPATTAVADAKFVEIRAKSTATSGDNRLMYLRYNLAGAGASGECLRAFTDLTAAVSTARGAHISLQVSSTGYVSGLGVGLDTQLYVGNSTVAGGTYAAVNAEIYTAGASSSLASCTSAFFRAVNNGSAAATVDDYAVLFDLSGFTSGAAKLWYDHQGTAPVNVEEWVKVRTPAGIRWLPLYNAVV